MRRPPTHTAYTHTYCEVGVVKNTMWAIGPPEPTTDTSSVGLARTSLHCSCKNIICFHTTRAIYVCVCVCVCVCVLEVSPRSDCFRQPYDIFFNFFFSFVTVFGVAKLSSIQISMSRPSTTRAKGVVYEAVLSLCVRACVFVQVLRVFYFRSCCLVQ